MSSLGSVTKLIGPLKSGDAQAAQKLWDLFAVRLLALARRRLPKKPLGVADEEDVVQSAFGSFFAGVKEGEFPCLTDRKALWQVLSTITRRKASNLDRNESRQKRCASNEQESMTAGPESAREEERSTGEAAVDPKPFPDLQVMAEEAFQGLLDVLGDARLRPVAIWKMEGYTDAEIAARLGCTLRTVERKLHLIRLIWRRSDQRGCASDQQYKAITAR